MPRNRAGQKVRGGAFDFVKDAMQVKGDDGAEFFACGGLCASRLFEISDQAIESAVLAEKKDFVFAAEIVVKVSRGEIGGSRDFAHAGFGEAAGAEFAAGGPEDFESAGFWSPLQAGSQCRAERVTRAGGRSTATSR